MKRETDNYCLLSGWCQSAEPGRDSGRPVAVGAAGCARRDGGVRPSRRGFDRAAAGLNYADASRIRESRSRANPNGRHAASNRAGDPAPGRARGPATAIAGGGQGDSHGSTRSRGGALVGAAVVVLVVGAIGGTIATRIVKKAGGRRREQGRGRRRARVRAGRPRRTSSASRCRAGCRSRARCSRVRQATVKAKVSGDVRQITVREGEPCRPASCSRASTPPTSRRS